MEYLLKIVSREALAAGIGKNLNIEPCHRKWARPEHKKGHIDLNTVTFVLATRGSYENLEF